MKVRQLTRLSLAAACGAALLYAIGCSPSTPGSDETSLTRFRVGDLAQLQVPGEIDAPNPRAPDAEPQVFQPRTSPPDMAVEGPDGAPVKIADLRGNVVLVNMWATWCAPCKVEMPTLAALQAAYADKPLKVMPISADGEEAKAEARAFIAAHAPLSFYHTPGTQFAYAFDPATTGFPTTVIYDKQGVERARLVKDADWNSPEARALIDALLAE